jgi:hypothetical protein
MPYGIPNEKPEQTSWMERCVSGIKGKNKRTGKPYTEGDKIAVCKAQLKKQGWKASEESMSEESLRDLEEKIRRALEPFRSGPPKEISTNLWVADVFDDFAIIEAGNDLFKVPWKELKNGDIEFDFASKVKVQKILTYEQVVEESEKKEEAKKKKTTHVRKRITDGNRTIC